MRENKIKYSFFFILFFSFSLYADSLGSLLFHGNCITCHKETKAISAPSAVEFREHYLRAFPDKKDFVSYMSKWVQYPSKETSIMQDAIKKYELMPELGFEYTTLEIISEYIYETDFTKEHLGHKE